MMTAMGERFVVTEITGYLNDRRGGGKQGTSYHVIDTMRAWLVYLRDGHSWREWGTAGQCGLK